MATTTCLRMSSDPIFKMEVGRLMRTTLRGHPCRMPLMACHHPRAARQPEGAPHLPVHGGQGPQHASVDPQIPGHPQHYSLQDYVKRLDMIATLPLRERVGPTRTMIWWTF